MKHPEATDDLDRRAFFRSAGRNTLLGAMGLFGILVGIRERRTAGQQVCINRSVCGTCLAFGECELPAAQSMKQALGPTRQVQRPGGRVLRMSRTGRNIGSTA